MSAWTAGPWAWTWNGVGGHWALIAIRSDNYLAQHVNLGGPPGVPLTPDQLLVQEAPALAESLRSLLSSVEEHHRTDDPESLAAMMEAMSRARAVLGRVSQ